MFKRMPRLILFLSLCSVVAITNSFGQATGTVSGTVKVIGVKTPADVVVYLERHDGPIDVVPPKQPVIMDERNKEFIPHVLPIIKGTTVTLLNSDECMHNVHAYQNGEDLFNIALPIQGQKANRKLNKSGEVVLLCNVHPEMSAYIIVLETPYFTKTDADGKFTIVNVPEGTYVLKTWHETKASMSQEVIVGGANPTNVDLTLREKK